VFLPIVLRTTLVNVVKTRRYFCYIDKAVQMNFLAAMIDNEDATGKVFDVALNDCTSLNELYQMLEERLVQKSNRVKKNKPIFRGFRVGDVHHSQADLSKAKELLRYCPVYKISVGLGESIDWYINCLSKG